ncbi:hypothetical protein CASFOL_041234 [Castilleja foliolosa]|uniref:Uncharacterized protein n=1 Tax=Castilleja foliolosa TaxID=1961234 RepID=A0ABD3BEC9_9LAMI
MYDFVDLEVHFGGAFNDSGDKCYKGGGVTFFQALNAEVEVTVESDESVEIVGVKTGSVKTGIRKSMRLQMKGANVQKKGDDSEDDVSDEDLVLRDHLDNITKALGLNESSHVVASEGGVRGEKRRLVLQDEDSGESSHVVASVTSGKGKRRKKEKENPTAVELEDELDAEAIMPSNIVTPRRSVRLQTPSPDSCKNMAQEEIEKEEVNAPSSKKGKKKKVLKKGKKKVQAEAQEEHEVAPVEAQEVEPKLRKKKKRKLKFVPYWLK